MPFADILLHIDAYPDPTPPAAIGQAVAFVEAIEGGLSAVAVTVDIHIRTNAIAERLIGLSDIAEEEEARSRDAAREALEVFTAKARAAGVFRNAHCDSANLYLVAEQVARRARTHDLTLIPLVKPLDGQAEVVETVVFGSGRPVIVFKPGQANLPAKGIGTVVLAWDGSRCAARAMADALPLLAAAREVRILTVLDEKPAATAGLAVEALRHLAAHRIEATAQEVQAGNRSIGKVFDDYVAQTKADLLVMGAFGHSRVREFVLGGATAHVLHEPKVAVLLAH